MRYFQLMIIGKTPHMDIRTFFFFENIDFYQSYYSVIFGFGWVSVTLLFSIADKAVMIVWFLLHLV